MLFCLSRSVLVENLSGGGGEACREQRANQKGAEPCVTLREEGKKQK